MNSLHVRRRRRLGGVSAKAVALPLAFLVAALQIAIIVLIIVVNLQNAKISSLINDYANYRSEASTLVSGSSVLHGTATSYVSQPDKTDVGPLIGYVTELRSYPERRPDAIVGRFETYDVGAAPKEFLEDAALASNEMRKKQGEAIALMLSAYPSDQPLIATLELPDLDPGDEGLTADEKAAKAEAVLTAAEYASLMGNVSTNVNKCIDALQKESDAKIRQGMATIRGMRIALLATTASLSVILISAFLVIYLRMVVPLGKFVRGIASDHALDEKTGLYEVRRLANSYNALLSRREALETVLRFAAETDQLTNLPNRSRFEQYYYETGKQGGSLAFLVFDVNYLKEINDRRGHLAGDELIKNAAECISDCFGVPGESNCFRIGGDEFAAIVKWCSRADIERRLAWFAEKQKQMEISVAVGLAYAEDVGDTDFREMFLSADRNMYSDKMRAHGEKRMFGA